MTSLDPATRPPAPRQMPAEPPPLTVDGLRWLTIALARRREWLLIQPDGLLHLQSADGHGGSAMFNQPDDLIRHLQNPPKK